MQRLLESPHPGSCAAVGISVARFRLALLYINGFLAATHAWTQTNTQPEITSPATFNVSEGNVSVATLTATDPDADPLTWSIPPDAGPDAAQFELTESGVLTFASAPDYEDPADADGDNRYEVVVAVADGKNADGDSDSTVDDSVTVTIEVANVDEAGSVSLFPAQLRVRTMTRPTLSDPDGDIRTVAWQWAGSTDKITWTNIAGATHADYLPTAAYQGQYLRATATYTDGEGSGKTAQAESDAVVAERETAPELSIQTLVSGLGKPWGIAFAPDGTMLFTDGARPGKIGSRLSDGTVNTVAADLSDVSFAGNNGVMGIVVDPAFALNRRFYTCQGYTGPKVQVVAWTMNAAYTAATRANDPLVGGLPSTGANHNGCRLRFGPNGYLWIATGDTESTGSVPQDLTSLGGKMLRVDASTGAAAAGNPFGTRVYTYGHRNPQGLALRPGTSQMWSVEHGPTVDDEINLLVAGANYGWDPVFTDEHGNRLPGYNDDTPMTDLVKFPDAREARWSSGDPTLATSGGIFFEGDVWGAWEGRLAVATLKNRTLHIFRFTDEGALLSHVVPPELDHTHGRLRTPLIGNDRALYLGTNGASGRTILRVTPEQPPAFPSAAESLDVPENATVVGTVEATDFNHDPLTYTLSGADAAAFELPDPAIGELHVRPPRRLDYESRQTYEVEVTATDGQGASDSTTLAITVTDLEHEGTVTLPSIQPQAGAPFVATLSDPDGGVTDANWSWERSNDEPSGWTVIDGAESASYRPGPDDVGNYLRATVTYTNTYGPGNVAQQATDSTVLPALPTDAEFPAEEGTRRVDEDTAAGRPIGLPVEAYDANGDALQYTISGADAGLFDIVESSGQLLTKAALDYETNGEHEVVISVSDRKDTNGDADTAIDDSVAVTIEVGNVDEAGSVSLFPAQLHVRTMIRPTLSDPDGDVRTVAWRWARSADKTTWTNIAGATHADYLPAGRDRGEYLRATAAYTDGEGSGKTARTESDAVVGGREPGPKLSVVPVVADLSTPWGIAFAPDGTMLFTERGGTLSSRLTDGTVQGVAADFTDLYVNGETGLMGIEVDPNFAVNRRFYTCQGHTGPKVQVIAWTMNAAYTSATRVNDPLVDGPSGRQPARRLPASLRTGRLPVDLDRRCGAGSRAPGPDFARRQAAAR